MAAEACTNATEYSSIISVKEFKQQFLPLLTDEPFQEGRKDRSAKELSSEMGIPEAVVTELAEVCSPSNLKCSAEANINPDDEKTDLANGIPEGVQLETIRLVRERLSGEIMKVKRKEKRPPVVKVPKKAEEFEAIHPNEVVLAVAVYHPTRLERMQEFLVLGKQKLSCLRDAISCSEDLIVAGDQSDNPNLHVIRKLGELFKSGFFFIEGVFYSDMRDPLARDYSKTIMDWIKFGDRWKEQRLGIFTTKLMNEMTFEELKIKLGYPYLYCHQGNCEHLVVFKDLRFLDCDDPQNGNDYPHKFFDLRARRRICCCCDNFTAVWILKNDSLALEDPAFFCDSCHKMLHFTKDGAKIGNFQAFSYTCEPWQIDLP